MENCCRNAAIKYVKYNGAHKQKPRTKGDLTQNMTANGKLGDVG